MKGSRQTLRLTTLGVIEFFVVEPVESIVVSSRRSSIIAFSSTRIRT